MLRWLRSQLLRLALNARRHRPWYFKYCRPNGEEWAEFMRRWGGFHRYGIGGCFTPGATVTDPAYTSIGDHVTLSVCTLIGHDAAAPTLGRAYGKKLDAVGKIVIGDHCFIGHGAIVMPGVTVGARSVVAAGAVVTKDVDEAQVVAGVPARVICSTETLVAKYEAQTKNYPWADLINQREGTFDPELEPRLREMRVRHFYPDDSKSADCDEHHGTASKHEAPAGKSPL